MAAPLHALTKKGTPFLWTSECQESFQALRGKLSHRPVTAFPDFNQPFRVYTDASNTGLGAILAQVQGGKERIILSASRSLTSGEKNYATTQKECLAIFWAVTSFRHFLLCQPFEIYTDHYSLKWLRTMKTSNSMLHRWAATLEEYQYTIIHKPGKQQTHVDALSRLGHRVATLKLITPTEAQKVLQEIHGGTHLGIKGTLGLFNKRFRFKGAKRLCRQVVKGCQGCQIGKDYGRGTFKTEGSIAAPRPWHTVALDVMGPFRAFGGKRFIISIIDCYSKFSILLPQADHSASTVARLIFDRVVAYFGVPERILTDNGPEFSGRVWHALKELLGHEVVHSSPYHPQGNGIVERLNRTCLNLLRASLVNSATSDWPALLPSVMLSLNAMPHEPHGYSAAEVLFGTPLRLPPDPPSALPIGPLTPSDYVEQLKKTLTDVRRAIPTPTPPPPKVNPFRLKELILVVTQPHERTHKLAPRWAGPYPVVGVRNPYQVEYSVKGVVHRIHISQAKRYRSDDKEEGKRTVIELVRNKFTQEKGVRSLALPAGHPAAPAPMPLPFSEGGGSGEEQREARPDTGEPLPPSPLPRPTLPAEPTGESPPTSGKGNQPVGESPTRAVSPSPPRASRAPRGGGSVQTHSTVEQAYLGEPSTPATPRAARRRTEPSRAESNREEPGTQPPPPPPLPQHLPARPTPRTGLDSDLSHSQSSVNLPSTPLHPTLPPGNEAESTPTTPESPAPAPRCPSTETATPPTNVSPPTTPRRPYYITRFGRTSKPVQKMGVYDTVRKVRILHPDGSTEGFRRCHRLQGRLWALRRGATPVTVCLVPGRRVTRDLRNLLRRHFKEDEFEVRADGRGYLQLAGASASEGEAVKGASPPTRAAEGPTPCGGKRQQDDKEESPAKRHRHQDPEEAEVKVQQPPYLPRCI